MVTVTMVRIRKDKGKTLKKNSESVKHPPLIYITSITLYIVSKVKYIQLINNCMCVCVFVCVCVCQFWVQKGDLHIVHCNTGSLCYNLVGEF